MVKIFNTILLLLLNGFFVTAKDYPNCSNHYFKNGKIASSACYDADHRWGKAQAYSITGAIIYEKELRTIAGHSSVIFSYYEDGAVKKAEWSSAPDAGIQWYSSVTTFSENGVITGFTENNYDNKPGIAPRYTQTKPPPVTKPAPVAPRSDSSHTAYCAVIYSSEFWYINNNNHAVAITATRGPEHTQVIVPSKETVKGGYLILAQQFDDPARYFQFSVTPEYSYDKAHYNIRPSSKKPEQVSKEVRRYYFEIERITPASRH